MKFLLFVLAVFSVAQASVIQPEPLQEALDKIKAAIPTDKIIEIIQSCENDPEVQGVAEYLRTEFPVVFLEVLRNDAELQGFFKNLYDLGVTFDWWNYLPQLLDVTPIKSGLPNSCGGWRGVYERIQQEITLTDIVGIMSQVYNESAEFAKVWDRIGAADETVKRLLANSMMAAVFESLAGLGLDLEFVKDFINELFGWSL